jgi:septum formation protein
MIYLASQSPRRQALLTQIGIAFEVLLPASSEASERLEEPLVGEAPSPYVKRVTGLKLDAALARLKALGKPSAPVLCADTTVCIGRTILGKPASAQEAKSMLALLAGREHRVLTAVAVQWGDKRLAISSTTRVQFGALSAAQIEAYVESGEPFGKAGAYGIQGQAGAFVAKLSGSYSGVVGLPLYETAALLASIGYCGSIGPCNKTF